MEFLNDEHPEKGVIEESKNIFWKVTVWSVKTFGKFYSKGLTTCPVCMASTHSTYVFWPVALMAVGFHWWLIPLYLLYVPSLAGFNWYKLEAAK